MNYFNVLKTIRVQYVKKNIFIEEKVVKKKEYVIIYCKKNYFIELIWGKIRRRQLWIR